LHCPSWFTTTFSAKENGKLVKIAPYFLREKKQQHAISVAGADQSVLIWMNYNHPHMATVSAIFSLVNYYDQATLNPVMVIFL
jgi:hypothetical protein